MNEYKFEYWYRYGKFDKEFDQVTIKAETKEQAIEDVKRLKKFVIPGSIKLMSTNGKISQ